jgi:hypothetical protein
MTKRIRTASLVVVGLCVMSLTMASDALAAEAPHWVVEGVALKAGESRPTTGKNIGNFEMTTSSMTVVCAKATSAGAIGGESAGTATGKMTMSECTVKGKPECHINSVGQPQGTIDSESGNSELVFLTERGAENGTGELAEFITPPTTGSKSFTEIETNGSECSVKGTSKATGSVIAKVAPVEEEAEVGRLIFPKTSILHAYRWESSGGGKEIIAGLKVGSVNAGMHGEEEFELESKDKFGAFG